MATKSGSGLEWLLAVPIRIIWSLVGWFILLMVGSMFALPVALGAVIGWWPLYPHMITAWGVGVLFAMFMAPSRGTVDRGGLVAAVLAIGVALLVAETGWVTIQFTPEFVVVLTASAMAVGGDLIEN